ncbi:MAG: ABC transporter substrate-binding protein [Gammaproteobacteria bacterium]|jgi:phospholipid transport system substrate-binding protein|nr:ABC transporter substrate-binding protein [Gammaproteobacteria bacterium]
MKITATISLLCSLLLSANASADSRTPEQIIEQTSSEVLTIVNQQADRIRNEAGYVNTVIDELILPIIDLQSMGKLILGKHWKSATSGQQQRFIDEFKSMLVRTYAKSIADYGHAKVTIMRDVKQKSKKFHMVHTELDLGSGAPLKVTYVFRQKDSAWRVFDLAVDGLSLVKNFRSSFDQEISETSLQALIERIANTNSEAATSST